jgi:hypothetical protein
MLSGRVCGEDAPESWHGEDVSGRLHLVSAIFKLASVLLDPAD